MELIIQDPNDAETTYLLEALIGACTDAKKGGGAFAFVSPSGVKLLLNDKTFSKFGVHPFPWTVCRLGFKRFLVLRLDASSWVISPEHGSFRS